MTIVYGAASWRSLRPALKASASSQRAAMRASTAAGSNVLSIIAKPAGWRAGARKRVGYKPDGNAQVNRVASGALSTGWSTGPSAPAARHALYFRSDQALDHRRQVFVQPTLEHGPQEFLDQILQ